MLADFYISRLSNDMKIAVQQNHLGGAILYRSFDPSKKRRPKTTKFPNISRISAISAKIVLLTIFAGAISWTSLFLWNFRKCWIFFLRNFFFGFFLCIRCSVNIIKKKLCDSSVASRWRGRAGRSNALFLPSRNNEGAPQIYFYELSY